VVLERQIEEVGRLLLDTRVEVFAAESLAPSRSGAGSRSRRRGKTEPEEERGNRTGSKKSREWTEIRAGKSGNEFRLFEPAGRSLRPAEARIFDAPSPGFDPNSSSERR